MMHSSDFRKIDLVCDSSDDRPELQNVYLHEGHLYAADGYTGACLPACLGNKDTDGAIPLQAVVMACAFRCRIAANETVRVEARKCTFDRPENGWPACFESFREAILGRTGPRPETHEPTVILDAQRLWRLAQAISKDDYPGYGVELHLGLTGHAPVLVKPYGCHDDTLGAIMPIASQHPNKKKANLWDILGRLREHIDNGAEDVKLTGDLLTELRKALCVKQEEE